MKEDKKRKENEKDVWKTIFSGGKDGKIGRVGETMSATQRVCLSYPLFECSRMIESKEDRTEEVAHPGEGLRWWGLEGGGQPVP